MAFAAVCASVSIFGVATAAAERLTGPPHSSVAPAISGTPTEHKRVKTSHGVWTGATPITYSYTWSRCNSSGGECQAIGGAARSAYQPVSADVGHRLISTVKATNGEGSAEAPSAPSAVIGATGPKHKGTPALSGEFVDGRVVTVANGTWNGTPPFDYTYQWLRCGHGPCTPIAGAAGQSYRVQSADIGHKLKAIVTAANTVGSGSVRSKSSAKVLPGSPLNLAAPDDLRDRPAGPDAQRQRRHLGRYAAHHLHLPVAQLRTARRRLQRNHRRERTDPRRRHG